MKSFTLVCLKLLIVWVSSLWPGLTAQALTLPVHEIQMLSADKPLGEPTPLPHFIEQRQSGLLTVRWQIPLPAQLAEADIPALLMPQAVQGLRLRLRGQLIYELAPSNEQWLHNWHVPALVTLPKAMLEFKGNDVLEFEQTGHMRGWLVPPMLLGEFQALRPLSDTYAFISQTMTTTIVAVCGFWGIFLIVVGGKSQAKLLVYGGWISVLWSAMIGIAFISQMPTPYWPVWRIAIYFLIGWLIYCEILFNCAIQQALAPLAPRFAAVVHERRMGGVCCAGASRRSLSGCALDRWHGPHLPGHRAVGDWHRAGPQGLAACRAHRRVSAHLHGAFTARPRPQHPRTAGSHAV